MTHHNYRCAVHTRTAVCLLWLLSGCLIGSWPCAAQAAAKLSDESDFLDGVPVVISATRLAQPVTEAPASITVIDRAMIDASGAVELADLLRLVPGFQVAYGTHDAAFAVTYHGQSDGFPHRLQVLIDGRVVYGAAFSHVDWVTLGVQMDDIERIEVIRGSDTPVYGANAFMAVVNIITKASFQEPGAFVKATVGAMDTRGLFARYSGVGGEHYSYRVSAAYRSTEGFNRRNDEYELSSLDYRADIEPTTRDRLQVEIGLLGGPMGAGGEHGNPITPFRNKAANNEYESLRWSRVLEGGESALQIYHNRHWERDTYSIMPLSALLDVAPGDIPGLFPGQTDQTLNFGVYDYTGERFDLEWQYASLPNSSGLRFVGGSGARLDRMRSAVLINEGEHWVSNRSLRLFGNLELRPLRRVVVNAGAMAEWSDIAGGGLSPRLGVNYLLADHQALRASITRALRNPSLLEEHFDYGLRFNDGSPLDVIHYSFGNLNPERLVSTELAYIGQWPERGLSAELKLFRERLSDEIDEVRFKSFPEPMKIVNKGVYLRSNGGRTTINGVEGQLRFVWQGGGLLTLNASIADADSRPSVNATKLDRKNSGTPSLTAGLLISQPLDQAWTAGFAVYRLDKMAWYGDGSDVKGYTRVDLRLARRLYRGSQRGLIELLIQNLGPGHMEFLDKMEFPRKQAGLFGTRVFVRASFELN